MQSTLHRSEIVGSTVKIALSDDRHTASVEFLSEGVPQHKATYNASELDELIASLSEARARLAEEVRRDHREGLQREIVVVDPMWRTELASALGLDGVMLRMRHQGLGWTTFLLPHREATALGDWLSKNARHE
jgi:hypothetical protein